MSNTESISAKLRRWADESYESGMYPTERSEIELKVDGVGQVKAECNLFRNIADEIDAEKRSVLRNCAYPLTESVGKPLKGDEDFKSWLDRYYLPRPLFEDGEPVQFGDRFVNDSGRNDTLSSLNYTKGDHDYVSVNGGKRHEVTSRLKCPEPQVLDADGVPIVVGDKVYLVPGKHCETFPLYGYKAGVEYTVSENESAIHKEDGRICITGGDCTCGYPMPEQVTHREPDTQERIEEDATMPPREYYVKHIGHDVGLKDDEEVWTAVTAHLLRRQRELDGRDA